MVGAQQSITESAADTVPIDAASPTIINEPTARGPGLNDTWDKTLSPTKRNQPAVISITRAVLCPCLVRFRIFRNSSNANNLPKFDFLVVPAEQPANGTRSYIPRYSVRGKQATRRAEDGRWIYESQGFEIAEPRRFVVVIRYEGIQERRDHTAYWFLQPVPRRCPVRLKKSITNRIVGGTDAEPKTKLLAVSFERRGALICSGSLIAPLWVLTAAHCQISSTDVAYVAGANGLSGTPAGIVRSVSHPRFRKDQTGGPNDIALVQLQSPSLRGIEPVVLNSRPGFPSDLSIIRIVGYGRLYEDFSSVQAPMLRTVDLPVFPMDRCKLKISSGIPLDGSIQLCAGYEDGECDACQGDSGGGALAYDSIGNPVQVALVSFGKGCARQGVPGVYTRVQPYLGWIRRLVPEVRVSNGAVDVKAETLKSGTLAGAEFAGTGTDGIQPETNDGFDGDDEMIAKWLKFAIPGSLGALGLVASIIACCCSVCVLRVREKRTVSDLATGKFTWSILGPRTELGYSLGQDDAFGDSVNSTPTKPPPIAINLPLRRGMFGRRRKQETVVIPDNLQDNIIPSSNGDSSSHERAAQSQVISQPPVAESNRVTNSQQLPSTETPAPNIEDQPRESMLKENTADLRPMPPFPPGLSMQPRPNTPPLVPPPPPPPIAMSSRRSTGDGAKPGSSRKKKRRSVPEDQRRIRLGDGPALPPAPPAMRNSRRSQSIGEHKDLPNTCENGQMFSEDPSMVPNQSTKALSKRRSAAETVPLPIKSTAPIKHRSVPEGESAKRERRSMTQTEQVAPRRHSGQTFMLQKQRSMPESRTELRGVDAPGTNWEDQSEREGITQHNAAMMVLGSLGFDEVEPEQEKSRPFLQPSSHRR